MMTGVCAGYYKLHVTSAVNTLQMSVEHSARVGQILTMRTVDHARRPYLCPSSFFYSHYYLEALFLLSSMRDTVSFFCFPKQKKKKIVRESKSTSFLKKKLFIPHEVHTRNM